MKRIGTLNGKAIVTGDSNAVTKNQILYNKEKNGSIHLSERDNSGDLKPITGGGGGDSSLTKGKKILSEYYYIDYFKIMTEGTEDANLCLRMVMDFISNDSFIEDEWYGAPTEVGDIIFKVKYDNDYVYMYDIVAPGSGATNDALAIRKYCKIKTPDSTVLQAHINDYVPVFLGTALFITPLGSGVSPEDLLPIVNNTYKTIISTLSPYFISEEEFWNEANIVENAETVLNDWLSQ